LEVGDTVPTGRDATTKSFGDAFAWKEMYISKEAGWARREGAVVFAARGYLVRREFPTVSTVSDI
jgi:hypothetical protein